MKKRLFGAIEILVVACAVFAANLAVSMLCVRAGKMMLAMALSEFAMLAVVVAATLIRRRRLTAELSVAAPTPRSLFPSLVMALGVYFATAAFTYFMMALFPSLTNTTDQMLYDNILKGNNPVLIVIVVAVIPAVCEELIFRGYFQSRLMEICPPWLAIILSGMIFGAAHADLYKLLPITIMGIGFAFIAYKTKSIVITSLLHMINNALSLVQMFSGDSGAQTEYGEIVFEGITAVLYGFGSLVLAGLFVYLALRLFKVINLRRRWITAIVAAGCVTVYVLSVILAAVSTMNVRMSVAERYSYPETDSSAYTFKLDKTRICVFSFSVISGDSASVTVDVKDSAGNSVYSHALDYGGVNEILVLDGGEYTVSYSISPAENAARDSFNYNVVSRVISFYHIAERSEVTDNALPAFAAYTK